MAAGPTRAEVLGELIEIVNADYTRAVTLKTVNCPDCDGHGEHVRKVGPEDFDYANCATCQGTGIIEMEDIDAKSIPDDLKPHVTEFKVGRGGKLLPVFKSKDKALVNLINVLGIAKQTLEVTRSSYGEDLTDEQLAQQAKELRKQLGLAEPVIPKIEADE